MTYQCLGLLPSEWGKDGTKRLHGSINGRYVTSITRLVDNTTYCLDSTCYHAGGPLGLGDVEEVNHDVCLICPWHSYPISLKDGGKWYEKLTLDPTTKRLLPGGWGKKERAQRVHHVELRDARNENGGKEVWVMLSTTMDQKPCDSDAYGTSRACGERIATGDKTGMNKGRDGKMPVTSSAQVFLMGKKVTATTSQMVHQVAVKEIERNAENAVIVKLTGWEPMHDRRLVVANVADLLITTHVLVRLTPEGEQRNYTVLPTLLTNNMNESSVEIALRVYSRQGSVSKMIANSSPGTVMFISPSTDPSSDDAELRSKNIPPHSVSRVLLIAGGSGITAMVSVAQAFLDHTAPTTRIMLLCLDRNEDTILLRSRLAAWALRFPDRVILKRLLSSHRGGSSPQVLPGEATVETIGSRCDARFMKSVIESTDFLKGQVRVLACACGPSSLVMDAREWIPQIVESQALISVVGFW